MKSLSIFFACLVLLAVAPLSFAYPRAGYQAELSTLFHNVSGTVTIVDADTLLVENFYHDGLAPNVFFYLGADDTQAAFLAGTGIGPQLNTEAINEVLTLELTPPATFDGYNAISVWCITASANFGSGTFVKVDPTPDVSWTFDNLTTQSYLLNSFEPNDIPFGTLGAEDPTLLLELGKRYQVTVVNYTPHPFEVLAKGANSTLDTVLLSMASSGLTFESDSEVAWTDDGAGTVAFTLTQDLYDAMTGASQNPGYRCGVHVGSMRGDFDVCLGEPLGDLDGNCSVDLLDLSLFAQNWLFNNIGP